MNNRLDFINEFINKDLAIREMKDCRYQFIELDKALQIEAKVAIDYNIPGMARSIANARTRLEEALQHAIKALCLKHEKIVGRRLGNSEIK